MRLCLGSSFTNWVQLITACLVVFRHVTAQQDVAFATTAEELQRAVISGNRHIIIQNHIDLRTLSADPGASIAGTLLVITSKTKSIRGDCTGIEPEGVALSPQATSIGQCVLRANSSVFELSNVSSELLLSDVYIRLERTATQMATFLPLMTISSGSAWVTTSVFRGDRTNCRAVDLGRGQKFHGGRSFFVGFQADDSAAVRVAAGARAGFKDCNFNLNTATLHGSSVGMDSGAIRDTPAACWFESCNFPSNIDPQPFSVSQTDDRAMHYNSRSFQKSFDVKSGDLIEPKPTDIEALNRLGFLIATAETYTEIANEQAQLTNLKAVEIDTFEEAVTSEGEGGPGIGPIVGGIGAAIVVIVGALAAFLIVRQRRQQKARRTATASAMYAGSLDGQNMKHRGSSTNGSGSTVGMYHAPFPGQHMLPAMRQSGQGLASDVSVGPSRSSIGQTMNSDEPLARAGLHGSVHDYGTHNDSAYRSYQSQDRTVTNQSAASFTGIPEHVGGKMDGDCLEEALDDIFDRRILFLGRFELYSQVHRRVGGQGIVQPARGRYDDEEYAIKFFLNRVSFEREEALYLREDLRPMMPAVKDIVPNSDGAICDMAGRIFPPAIVIERGEPLDEWALRIEPDFPTILTVLCHILARLQQLHSAGIAHRDIKPGNVLWRPKHHSWTLIDFGCAAEIGQTCPLSLSLLYAAPESLHALEAGLKTVVADPATDIWALGVISFELLTASRAFARSMSGEDIRAAISGRAPLPWETQDFRKKNIPELRMLRRSVLSCLNRDPQRRPTSTALLQSWNGLFDQATKGTLTEEAIDLPPA